MFAIKLVHKNLAVYQLLYSRTYFRSVRPTPKGCRHATVKSIHSPVLEILLYFDTSWFVLFCFVFSVRQFNHLFAAITTQNDTLACPTGVKVFHDIFAAFSGMYYFVELSAIICHILIEMIKCFLLDLGFSRIQMNVCIL